MRIYKYSDCLYKLRRIEKNLKNYSGIPLKDVYFLEIKFYNQFFLIECSEDIKDDNESISFNIIGTKNHKRLDGFFKRANSDLPGIYTSIMLIRVDNLMNSSYLVLNPKNGILYHGNLLTSESDIIKFIREDCLKLF